MDPLQRTAGPAPTASSQDPTRIRRSERNSPVKNRMRETCKSGSVRGGVGDIPTSSEIDALRGDQTGGESRGIGQMREIAEEAEALRVEGGSQAFEEQATEQAGERLDGGREGRAPRAPARALNPET